MDFAVVGYEDQGSQSPFNEEPHFTFSFPSLTEQEIFGIVFFAFPHSLHSVAAGFAVRGTTVLDRATTLQSCKFYGTKTLGAIKYLFGVHQL